LAGEYSRLDGVGQHLSSSDTSEDLQEHACQPEHEWQPEHERQRLYAGLSEAGAEVDCTNSAYTYFEVRQHDVTY
jgi:hypothetical protein